MMKVSELRNLCVLILVAGVCSPSWAQNIRLIGRAEKSGIRLRWAPTTPVLWQKANKYGYTIERYVIVRDRKIVDRVTRQMQQKTMVKALGEWEQLINSKETERHASIAAQAIYGARFNVQTKEQNSFSAAITGIEEQEMRYSFALMSADYSFQVSEAMGIGLVDKDVRREEKYMYKVYMNLPPGEPVKSDTGYVFVGLEDYQELPPPDQVQVQFGDRAAVISWNTMYQENIYTGYFIERSDDMVNFHRLTEIPIAIMERDSKISDGKHIYKTDSLPQNDRVYYYRVIGHTPYGDQGPPSKPVSGAGVDSFSAMPFFESPQLRNGKAVFSWRFRDDKDKELAKIKGFVIEKTGAAVAVEYRAVHREMLSPSTRTYTDQMDAGSFYYRLKLIDKNDRAYFSFPQLVQAIDSIPPAIPVRLSGVADTLGLVHLNWGRVRDKDVLGYKVFRSNHRDSEFSLINTTPVSDSTYVDEIDVQSLTAEIYYRVVAVDRMFNHSGYSEILEIIKPDRIGPAPPVLRSAAYLKEDKRVKIIWTNSGSNDVTKHVVYRSDNDLDWSAVTALAIGDSLSAFFDDNLAPGKRYSYAIVAIDKSKNESKPSNIRTVVIPKEKVTLTGLTHRINASGNEVTIAWDRSDRITHYQIYQSVNNGGLTFQKKLDGTATRFVTAIDPLKDYTFRVKVFFKDNPAVFSEAIVVRESK